MIEKIFRLCLDIVFKFKNIHYTAWKFKDLMCRCSSAVCFHTERRLNSFYKKRVEFPSKKIDKEATDVYSIFYNRLNIGINAETLKTNLNSS